LSAFPRPETAQLAAADLQLSAAGQEPCERLERGALAGAVRSGERVYAAASGREIERLYYRACSPLHTHSCRYQQRGRHAAPPRSMSLRMRKNTGTPINEVTTLSGTSWRRGSARHT